MCVCECERERGSVLGIWSHYYILLRLIWSYSLISPLWLSSDNIQYIHDYQWLYICNSKPCRAWHSCGSTGLLCGQLVHLESISRSGVPLALSGPSRVLDPFCACFFSILLRFLERLCLLDVSGWGWILTSIRLMNRIDFLAPKRAQHFLKPFGIFGICSEPLKSKLRLMCA